MELKHEEKLRDAAKLLKARRKKEAALREQQEKAEEDRLLVEEKYATVKDEGEPTVRGPVPA
jgi:hypothetical protein